MKRAERFWWGVLGAALPEVLRFYNLAQRGQVSNDQDAWQIVVYVVASIVYLAVAGFVTVAWAPRNRKEAIWVGASVPLIGSALVQTAPSLPVPLGLPRA
jgi:hypothetical protein